MAVKARSGFSLSLKLFQLFGAIPDTLRGKSL
jgi:hypothetical protein